MPNRLHVRARARAAAAIVALLVSFGSTFVPGVTSSETAAATTQLTRYTYLTDLVGGNVTVNWATLTSGSTGSVKYGTPPNCTANTVTATRTSITVGSTSEYQWKAMLTGLAGDTQYCYRAYLGSTDLLGTDPSPTFRSQIPAGATTPYSFAVFGDWGAVDTNGNNVDQANLMSQISLSGARFAVTTGDTGYPSGSQLSYGDLQQKGPNTSTIFGSSFWTVAGSSIPLFNSQGNHGLNSVPLSVWPQDRAVSTSGGRYRMDTYCCPNGSSSASYPSAWYAFDAGNARFYVLTAAWSDANIGTATAYKNDFDTHWTQSSPEYMWLQQDLQNHPTALKFAFWHYPLYSDNATETSDIYLRGTGSLEGLLATYGVSLGFNGHAHMYQRNTKPAGGIVTSLSGGGGAKLEPISRCSSTDAYGLGWSYSSNKGSACGAAPKPSAISQVFHFLLVSVNGTTVTVKPIDSQGHAFDIQTYSFSGAGDTQPPSPPTNLTATAPLATQVNLSWTAATDDVGVVAYDVYRDGGLLASLGNVTSYTDTTVAASTTYQYTVKARDAAGNTSPASNAATVTTPAPPPTLTFAPTDDTYIQASSPDATAGSTTTIQVDNSPVKNMLLKFTVSGLGGRPVQSAKLRLYCTDPSPVGGDFHTTVTNNWSQGAATWNNAPAANPATVASLGSVAANTWYEVDLNPIVSGDGVVSLRVTSASSDGANYTSNEGTAGFRPQLVVAYENTAPPPPTALTATPGSNLVNLSWTASSGATGYNVYRGTSSSNEAPTPINSSPVSGTTYADSGLTNGTTYYYVVTALNATGESGNSNEANATPGTRTFVFSDGFETGNLSKWTTNGGLTVQSTIKNTGSFAAQGNTTNGATYAKKLLSTTYTDGYFRIYFYLASGYSSQVNVLRYRTAADGSMGYLFVSTTGQLSLRNDVSAVTTTSATSVSSDAWHALELHLVVNGTSSSTEVWLDNVKINDLSLGAQNWGTTAIGKVQIGEVQTGRIYNVIFDDAAFDTLRIGLAPV